jgi:hypothetical protein
MQHHPTYANAAAAGGRGGARAPGPLLPTPTPPSMASAPAPPALSLSRAFERGDFGTMVAWADRHIPALLGTRREGDVTP